MYSILPLLCLLRITESNCITIVVVGLCSSVIQTRDTWSVRIVWIVPEMGTVHAKMCVHVVGTPDDSTRQRLFDHLPIFRLYSFQ